MYIYFFLFLSERERVKVRKNGITLEKEVVGI